MNRSILTVIIGLLLIVCAQSSRDLKQFPDVPGPPQPPPPLPPGCPTGLPFTDADLLNFALQLECLEAEFYSWAAFGRGLSPDLLGGGPGSTGGMKAALTTTAAAATEVANDEMNHVKFLRQALGSKAVACPLMDIGQSFASAANLAFNKTLDPPFSPYANDLNFLVGAFIFEDVGVTAYAGAAPYISDRTFLAAAASIHAVEGYHAGYVRTQIAAELNTVTPYGVTVGEISNAISDLRDRLAGSEKDQGVLDPDTKGPNIVPTDANSLVFARTPAEVIKIVTPFFPNGLNGYNFAG